MTVAIGTCAKHSRHCGQLSRHLGWEHSGLAHKWGALESPTYGNHVASCPCAKIVTLGVPREHARCISPVSLPTTHAVPPSQSKSPAICLNGRFFPKANPAFAIDASSPASFGPSRNSGTSPRSAMNRATSRKLSSSHRFDWSPAPGTNTTRGASNGGGISIANSFSPNCTI